MKKTKLFDTRKTIKIALPSFPDSEVELWDGLLTSEFEVLSNLEKDYDRGIETLRFLIKAWSFVDEKDETLDVTKETLGKLPARDFTFMMEQVGDIMETMTEKKEVSSKE
ncbi:MAG: hypothetical protein KJI69_05975 [Patescibacteria group bacterium]|nr:hypothetical protein [Patescibacteria group bacterium]